MEQTTKTVEQKEFIDIVNTHFNGNLKDANFALKKYIQSIEYKKHFNKIMYEKNKNNDEFKEKKKNMIKNIIKNIRKHYLKTEKKNIIMIMSLRNK